MDLQDDPDWAALRSAQIQNIIHTKSTTDPDISMVILFVPTDTLHQFIEATDDDFPPDVLAASIVSRPEDTQRQNPLTFDGLAIDPATRKVLMGTKTVSLPRRQFDLLLFLARHPQCVFTRSQLLDHVWGYDYEGSESTVTVHIRRLRAKIEPIPDQPVYLHTVWGVGYMFSPD